MSLASVALSPNRTKDRVMTAYRQSLAAVLAAAAIPYGMTAVVSSELLVLRHYRGDPGIPAIFAFALGAVAGYGLLTGCNQSGLALTMQVRWSHMAFTGASHAFAIGTALALGCATAQVPNWYAWPLTAAVGVSSYIAVAAAQQMLVARL